MATYWKVPCLIGLLYCLVFAFSILGMAQITTGASMLGFRSTPEAAITFQHRATPGSSLIVAGTLLLISAVLGFVGATRVSWPWLCVLGAALSLLTALQIVIAVVGFVEAGATESKVNKALYISLQHYRNEHFHAAWDTVQKRQHCCGVNSFVDWDLMLRQQPAHGLYAPFSCCAMPDGSMCSGKAKILYRQGCFKPLAKKVKNLYTTGASLAVVAGCLQLLGMIASILLSTIHQEKAGYRSVY